MVLDVAGPQSEWQGFMCHSSQGIKVSKRAPEMEGFVQRNGYLIVEPWTGISGDGQVLEGSKATRLALWWLLSLSMYNKAGSAFQSWLLSSPLLLFSRAVGENIWKGFPGTGGNFQANETLSAQPGTPTLAICSSL